MMHQLGQLITGAVLSLCASVGSALSSTPSLHINKGHTGTVNACAMSSDLAYAVTAGDDGTVRAWEVATGGEVGSDSLGSYAINGLTFLDPRTVLLLRADGGLYTWTFGERNAIKTAVNGNGLFLASSPDSKTFAIGGRRDDVLLFTLKNDSKSRRLKGHRRIVTNASFSRDGRQIVTVSTDGTARVWRVADGRLLRVIRNGNDPVHAAVFSKDGSRVLMGDSKGWLQVVTLGTKAPSQRVRAHQRGLNALTLSGDGKFVYSAGWDGVVRRWSVDSLDELDRFDGQVGSIGTLGVAVGDAYVFAAGVDGACRIWSTQFRQVHRLLGGIAAGARTLVLSPDQTTLATAYSDRNRNARSLALWDLGTWTPRWSRPFPDLDITSTAFSLDGRRIAAAGNDGSMAVVDAVRGDLLARGKISAFGLRSVAWLPDSSELAVGGIDGKVRFVDADSATVSRTLSVHGGPVDAIAVSPNGTDFLTGAWDNRLLLWTPAQPSSLKELEGHHGFVTSATFLDDGRQALTSSWDETAIRWNLLTGRPEAVYAGHAGIVNTVRASPNEKQVLTGGADAIVRLWDARSGAELQQFIGHESSVTAVNFMADACCVISASADKTLRIWKPGSSTETARVVMFSDRSWITTANERFDTNVIDTVRGVNWIMPDDPLHALPPEIFMRDYFEPRLVPRLMAGEKFADLPPLDTLNRVQPLVKVMAVDPEGAATGSASADPQTVQVTVEVAGDSREFGLGNARRRMTTGAYDLRLFRDGQLVGQWPPEPVAAGARQVGREQELGQWRKNHLVVEYAEGASAPKRILFEGIRLPRIAGKEKVEFSAYAFNVDRVKSETSKLPHDLPKGVKPRVPRAYIVTIGVNAFEDEAWDLKYAANDARQSGSELKRRLEALVAPDGSKHYEKVVWVPLVSDADKKPGKARHITSAKADKKQIEAVLKTLAGQAVDPGALADIDSANDLRQVNPEDLLIIVISTHGLNEDGSFYFLPADIGLDFSPIRAPTPAAKAAMLARAVSNDELAQWLRGVDAVDQVMIIDACRSAASVQSAEFKPGPMGSRGLGQLAYDKGMRILAATQVEQDAVDGTDATKMGLLVYALITEGLRAGKADNAPPDGRIMLSEWLNYANRRVPGVFQDIQDGTIKGTKGEVEHSPDPKIDAARRASLQQPSLFDFARGRDLVLIAP